MQDGIFDKSMRIPQEYGVLDERVRFDIHYGMLKFTVGPRRWLIPLLQFSSDEISYIREIIEAKKEGSQSVLPHACHGCMTIPANGFGSHKYNWCRFSRTIARLQDEHVSTPTEPLTPPTAVTTAVTTATTTPTIITGNIANRPDPHSDESKNEDTSSKNEDTSSKSEARVEGRAEKAELQRWAFK